MRGALRQAPRNQSLCLQCSYRLLYGSSSAAGTPRLPSRSIHTSRFNGQSAAAVATATEDTDSRDAASRHFSRSSSSPPTSKGVQWGMGRSVRGGLAATEEQERQRLLRQEHAANPPQPRVQSTPPQNRAKQNTHQRDRPLIRYNVVETAGDRQRNPERPPIRYSDAGSQGQRPRNFDRSAQSRPRAWQDREARPNAIDRVLREGDARPAARKNERPQATEAAGWKHLRRTEEPTQTQAPRPRGPEQQHVSPSSRPRRPMPSFTEPPAREQHRLENTSDTQLPAKKVEGVQPGVSPSRRERDASTIGRERRAARYRRERDDDQDDLSDAALERIERHRQRKKERDALAKKEAHLVPVALPEFISVGTLAQALKVRVEDFVSKLSELGFDEVTNDHIIDAETAGLVAGEFGFDPILPRKASGEDLVAAPESDDKTFLMNRPPVVTIMGHVDHGKTTLLDWLRKSSVAASEHGGITQHIGAFTVPMPSGRVITFLDTPGHAAFLAMRARGANVTDIVILVVAADDSVKPQTIEAIKHAKDAKVPVIVAITKIDKPEANSQRVKQDLARYGIEVEDFGGDVQTVEVSGKTGQGMEDLEEAAVALADILDARAPTDGVVEGWVLESTSGKAGKIATVLVRRGTLVPGTILVAGTTWTRVRTIRDEHGTILDSAGPSKPVLIDGWRDQPSAGDEALQATSEQRAKEAIDVRLIRAETEKMAKDVTAANQTRSTNAAIEAAAKEAAASGEVENAAEYITAQKERESSSGVPELPLVLRGDVSGSVDALDAYVQSLAGPLIRPHVLRAQVGQITTSDVALAQITGGVIVGFNIDVPNSISLAAERAGVKVVEGNVIYKVIDDVKAHMEGRLPDLVSTRVLGEALVAQVFEISLGGKKKLKVAGVTINNGLMKVGGRVRILRGGKADDGLTSDLGAGRKGAHKVVEGKEKDSTATGEERTVYDGHISTLRHHKKEVSEMRKGSDCGLSFDAGFTAFEAGDRVQYYEELRERRKL